MIIPLLFFLYAIQGIPYGFQSRFLPIYLRSSSHMSLTSVGAMKLLYCPWIMKPLYAPLMEVHGTKQKWLQISIAGLLLISLLLAFTGVLHFFVLVGCLFAFNLAAASQDIAVDGLALRLLSTTSQVGQGNVAQVVGYKIGAIFGGGLLLTLSQWVPWSVLFLTLVAVYAVALVVVTFHPYIRQHTLQERREKPHHVQTRDHPLADGDQTSLLLNDMPRRSMKYMPLLKTVLQSRGTGAMLVSVLVYKLGEQGALNMLPLYMVDQKISLAQIGFWTGIVGQLASVAGSSFVGYCLASRSGSVELFYRLCGLRAVFIGVITLGIWGYLLPPDSPACFYLNVVLMNGCLFVGGCITTSAFTLMMLNSQSAVEPALQTTHYTLLATAEVFGKLAFSWISGAIADTCGYAWSYVLFTALAIAATVYIWAVRNRLRFRPNNIN